MKSTFDLNLRKNMDEARFALEDAMAYGENYAKNYKSKYDHISSFILVPVSKIIENIDDAYLAYTNCADDYVDDLIKRQKKSVFGKKDYKELIEYVRQEQNQYKLGRLNLLAVLDNLDKRKENSTKDND